MDKYEIVWDGQNGLTIPEGRVGAETPALIAQLIETGAVCIGQHTIFNELRLAMKHKKLDASKCVLIVGSHVIEFSPRGRPAWYPNADGFCLWDDQLHNLIVS